MSALTQDINRATFFDNLRSLIVLMVLVFHSGASYGTGVDFWPFHDKNPNTIIDLFMLMADVFMMAVLFFIAGYFAVPNIEKNGTWKFITGKLKRLGIPWLIITIIILPVIDYVNYYFQKTGRLPVRNICEHWILSIRKIGEFHSGWMDMSAYRNMTEEFYQRYMWFVSLLLLFFIVFALAYKTKKYFKAEGRKTDSSLTGKSVLKAVLLTLIINIVLFVCVRFLIYPEFMGMGWFSVLNIIQFQFGKLTTYMCIFVLGIYAYSNKWFTKEAVFGKSWIWALACFCLFGINMLVMKNLVSDNPSVIFKLAFSVLYPLWSFSFLGLFVSWTHKFWNRSTNFNRNLAKNSYNMYLIHYIFPFTLPLLLRHWEIPTLVKFATLSIVTIVFSYLISRYIIMPVQKLIKHTR